MAITDVADNPLLEGLRSRRTPEPWREAIAAPWPSVSTASVLGVVGPRAQALLLSGRRGRRLGRNTELENEIGDRILEVRTDGRQVEVLTDEDRSQSELLGEQFDAYGSDPIYEETL